jgi:hypothetical protein
MVDKIEPISSAPPSKACVRAASISIFGACGTNVSRIEFRRNSPSRLVLGIFDASLNELKPTHEYI